VKVNQLATVSVLAAISLLAGNGYFAKGLLTDVLNITVIRSLVAAFTIYVVVRIFGERIYLRTRSDYFICIGVGLLLGVHWLSFFYSMSISTVTLGMTALYTYPMMTLIFERVFFKKTAPLKDYLIAPFLLLGVWMMASSHQGVGTNNALGALLGIFSAGCFAARNILQEQFLKTYPAHHVIFYQVLTVAIMLLPLSLSQTSHIDNLISGANEWWLWLIIGIIFTALPHSLMAFSIQNIGAKSVSIIGCLQPVIATIISFFILDELASPQVFLGAAIIMAGALIEISKTRVGRVVSNATVE